jgi:hypothetical protein
MLSVNPYETFMWPANDMIEHRTMILGVATNKTTAVRTMMQTVDDITARSAFPIFLRFPSTDEIRLYSDQWCEARNYLGKVYVNPGIQLI